MRRTARRAERIDFALLPLKSQALTFPISQDFQSHRGTLFQFSRRALYFFGALLLLPWLAVAAFYFYPRSSPNATAGEPSPYDEYTHQCRPGPWGELQYTRILIEPPREFFSSDFIKPDPLRWVFVGYTAANLDELWRRAGLSAAEQNLLREPAALETTPNAVIVHPPAELVLNLSPDARARIYAVLSHWAENPNQNEPFRFSAENADEWFRDSTVPPDIEARVKRLLYRRGTALLFSDHDLILPLIPTMEGRIQLIRTLARKSTLLVKLRVRPGSDLDSLASYWGRGPRRKGIWALLQSISHRPRGITLDVAHLLPRFARARIFTYPQASDHPDDGNHDCHWTALNFFDDPPDEKFADTALVKAALEHDYAPITDRPLLGDVLTLQNNDGRIIHSCVYIADDIVFTKNGGSSVVPFILTTLSEVIAYYPDDPPLTVHAYRRKDF